MAKGIIIMGAPGTGKGSLSKKLSEKYNIPHLSSGDIFRYFIEIKNETGILVKKYLDQGKLVPDDIVINVLKERLLQPDCKNGYILDGFPRTLVQAQALSKMNNICPVSILINLNINDEILVKRIINRRVCKKCGFSYNLVSLLPKKNGICDKCGGQLIKRNDDNEEILRERLIFFHNYAGSLIDFYKKNNNLFFVDINLDDHDTVESSFKKLIEKIVNKI